MQKIMIVFNRSEKIIIIKLRIKSWTAKLNTFQLKIRLEQKKKIIQNSHF